MLFRFDKEYCVGPKENEARIQSKGLTLLVPA
jgi:hypothetical protein